MLDSCPETRSAAILMRFDGVGLSTATTTILREIRLELRPGPPTMLLGPNGAGKTSLLRLAMGLVEPSDGRLESPPAPPNQGPLRKAIVFQRPVMLRRSAAANVAFAMKAASRPRDAGAVAALLSRVGLAGLDDRPARRLSGGEQQRLALARALASEPQLLFLDEPTASLDPQGTKAIEDIVTAVAAAGTKIVMSTHDLGQARRLAGEIVFLAGGRLLEHSPAGDFFKRPRTDAARRFLAGDIVLT